MYGARYEHWRRRTEWPLAAASALFLAAFAVRALSDAGGTARQAASIVIGVTWLVLIIDYLVRLSIAEPRGRWFVRHLLDLVMVLLPMFRLLLLLRFVTAVVATGRGAGHALRGRVAIYTGATALLVMCSAALAVLMAEAGRGGTIDTFGEAMWWALVTMTTVGYGDYAPVTTLGRWIAAALMVGGVAVIGSATATVTSWIVEKISAKGDAEDAADEAEGARQIAALREEIAELKTMLRERGAG